VGGPIRSWLMVRASILGYLVRALEKIGELLRSWGDLT
jgi:hypothetical protein